MKETMNQEKLAKLQAQVRIGGKVSDCKTVSGISCSTENTIFISPVLANTNVFLFSIFI